MLPGSRITSTSFQMRASVTMTGRKGGNREEQQVSRGVFGSLREDTQEERGRRRIVSTHLR
ncbi:MAG: hypothetical protein ACK53Y_14210 [bacterium]